MIIVLFASMLQLYGKDLLVLLSDSEQLSFLTFNVELHRYVNCSLIVRTKDVVPLCLWRIRIAATHLCVVSYFGF